MENKQASRRIAAAFGMLHRVHPLQEGASVRWVRNTKLELEELLIKEVTHAAVDRAALKGRRILLQAEAPEA